MPPQHEALRHWDKGITHELTPWLLVGDVLNRARKGLFPDRTKRQRTPVSSKAFRHDQRPIGGPLLLP
jgi:hypothetical protein